MDVCSLIEVKGEVGEGGEGGGGGAGIRGCLGNHIAVPVPERYRFTRYNTGLVGEGSATGWMWGGGGGEPHTCRVLLEMKGTF